ncbi:hypothetical protein [Nannocystis punicea]|uniref:DUF3592 domain-containing protein n=1 Tax=Nannocystis punicea TaxID=2995304 RepID=A0ABY7GYJ1_9BACT|nr:hypothetical protein [Nannocystis poenicansa]WAS92051.1 hypothetical protein O0S08_38205 [Nannocystis poenicansa]
MNDALAARIVDSRDQHKLVALIFAGIVGFLGLMVGGVLYARANEAFQIAGLGGVQTDFDRELVARGWTRLYTAIGVLVGAVVACVAIYRFGLSRRRGAIVRVQELLERGARAEARVVQARRVSMTQLRLAVQVNGPVAPFSTLIDTRSDEAAFVNRGVEVAYDRADPRTYVLVPNW